jgi:hypothetical protein
MCFGGAHNRVVHLSGNSSRLRDHSVSSFNPICICLKLAKSAFLWTSSLATFTTQNPLLIQYSSTEETPVYVERQHPLCHLLSRIASMLIPKITEAYPANLRRTPPPQINTMLSKPFSIGPAHYVALRPAKVNISISHPRQF